MAPAGVERVGESGRWNRRSLLSFALAGAAVAGCLRYAYELVEVLSTTEMLLDFRVYLEGARLFAQRVDPYLEVVPNVPAYKYLPTLAMLLAPLTEVPPLAAQRSWTILTQLCLAAGLYLTLDLLPRRLSRIEALSVACLLFLYYPIYPDLKLGQVGAVTFALVALSLWCRQRDRPATAGVVLALAASLKIYPLGLCLYFLRQGERRLVGIALASFVAFQLLPTLWFGGDLWSAYLRHLPTFIPAVHPSSDANQSLYGFAARLAEWAALRRGVGSPAMILSSLVGLLLFVATLSVVGKRKPAGDVAEIEVAVVYLALILWNPVSWMHHFVPLLIALPALVERLGARLRGKAGRAEGLDLLLALGGFALLSQPYRLARVMPRLEGVALVFSSSLFLAGALLVWAVLMRQVYRGRETSS